MPESRARSLSCRMIISTPRSSITICAFTSDETEAPLFRLPVDPSPRNGLRIKCRMMVDKITTVPKSKVGVRVGRLSDEDILRLNRSLAVFLGLASSSRTSRQSRAAPRTRVRPWLRREPSQAAAGLSSYCRIRPINATAGVDRPGGANSDCLHRGNRV